MEGDLMFARPGITSLRDQAVNDAAAALGYPTLLRRSPLRALAYAQAGLAHGQYGYLDWIARQAVPFTASGQYLEAWAGLVGVTRKDATSAEGRANFVGTAGTIVPAGTELRSAGGGSYLTTLDAQLAIDGTAAATIEAVTAGSAYTLDDDAVLSLASPIVGVQSSVAADHVAPGTDPELDDPFRTRMLLRWARAPQGGAVADYVEWALAVPGVTRAWANPNGFGAGTVVVYTMWDLAEAASGGFPQGTDGVSASEARDTPATGDQLVVADALHWLRPVTALVYHCAPIPQLTTFNFKTQALVSQAVRAAAVAALDAVFLALADPLGGVLDTDAFETTVAAVPGMPRFTMTTPADEFSAPVGYLPVRGSVTWNGVGG
jgi:uncharacterized phage protein gp47/JayE